MLKWRSPGNSLRSFGPKLGVHLGLDQASFLRTVLLPLLFCFVLFSCYPCIFCSFASLWRFRGQTRILRVTLLRCSCNAWGRRHSYYCSCSGVHHSCSGMWSPGWGVPVKMLTKAKRKPSFRRNQEASFFLVNEHGRLGDDSHHATEAIGRQ